MASYRIDLVPSAGEEIEALPLRERRRILQRIHQLGDTPRPPGCKRLVGNEAYRIRQGDYRVLYTVSDDQALITVVKVGHRRDIYRWLKH